MEEPQVLTEPRPSRGGWVGLSMLFILTVFTGIQGELKLTSRELTRHHKGYTVVEYAKHLEDRYFNRPWDLYVFYFCCGITLFAVLIKASNTNLRKLPGPPPGQLDRHSANSYAGHAALGLLIWLLLTFLPFLTGRKDSSIWHFVVEGVALATVLVICRKPLADGINGLCEIGFRMPTLRQIAFGIASALPVYLCGPMLRFPLTLWLPRHQSELTQMKTSSTSLSLVAFYATVCVVGPIFEETVFRGLMLPALASKWKSPVLATLLTSLMFVVGHPNISVWPQHFVFACMACFLVYRTNSLWPGIAMHMTSNIFVSVPWHLPT